MNIHEQMRRKEAKAARFRAFCAKHPAPDRQPTMLEQMLGITPDPVPDPEVPCGHMCDVCRDALAAASDSSAVCK